MGTSKGKISGCQLGFVHAAGLHRTKCGSGGGGGGSEVVETRSRNKARVCRHPQCTVLLAVRRTMEEPRFWCSLSALCATASGGRTDGWTGTSRGRTDRLPPAGRASGGRPRAAANTCPADRPTVAGQSGREYSSSTAMAMLLRRGLRNRLSDFLLRHLPLLRNLILGPDHDPKLISLTLAKC